MKDLKLFLKYKFNNQKNIFAGAANEFNVFFEMDNNGFIKQISKMKTDFSANDPLQVKFIIKNCCKFDKLGNYFATGGDDGVVRLWRLHYNKGELISELKFEFKSHKSGINCIDFHPKLPLVNTLIKVNDIIRR